MTWPQYNTPHRTSHKPQNSSPLSWNAPSSSPPSSPPFSSPLSAVQSRRRSQYKARQPSSSQSSSASSASRSPGWLFRRSTESHPEKDIMRHKFQTKCFKRAAEARQSAVKKKRFNDNMGSDPFGEDEDMDDDVEETEDMGMSDELYRRIVAHANSKLKRRYLVSDPSIAGEVIDPDVDDISAWEAELQDSCPVDIEEAELEAYAEEYEKMVSAENDSDAIWDEFDDDCFLDDESMDIS